MSLRLKAPAKLNLRLKVCGVRQDGYHELNMINVTLDLHDEIILSPQLQGAVSLHLDLQETLSDASLADPEKNLAARAASQFLREFGFKTGIDIHLRKRIPSRAGLGGGSSDAAAVLNGLLMLFSKELAEVYDLSDRVLSIALRLGADVPYFLQGGLCLVRGIGEMVSAMDGSALNGTPCALLLPESGCDTSSVYRSWDELAREGKVMAGLDPYRPALRPGVEDLPAMVENDLLAAAARVEPDVDRVFKLLKETRPLTVSMSGSGSCVFALPMAGAACWRQKLADLAAEQGWRFIESALVC